MLIDTDSAIEEQFEKKKGLKSLRGEEAVFCLIKS